MTFQIGSYMLGRTNYVVLIKVCYYADGKIKLNQFRNSFFFSTLRLSSFPIILKFRSLLGSVSSLWPTRKHDTIVKLLLIHSYWWICVSQLCLFLGLGLGENVTGTFQILLNFQLSGWAHFLILEFRSLLGSVSSLWPSGKHFSKKFC